MIEPLNWGLIGTGRIAETFAADLRLTDSGRIAAVGSRQMDSANRFADRFDIPNRHASYEALVADPGVEVVYVATPHPLHHSGALLALRAGKSVLVEKPFTMNAGEADDLVATARADGLFLMEAMWTRFLPHIAEIRRLLAEGALGEIVMVTADHGQWFPKDRDSRLFAPELGGGALLDLGVYPVSFASMVLGKPDRIAALIEPTFTGVDGQASMLFGYSNGAQAALTCIKARAERLGMSLDIIRKRDLHIHIPEGAIPKDGPSAGITMATAMASALTRAPVRKNVAMTGEITLRGKVLPIGGVKEKLMAAHRFGLDTIIMPKDNEKDLPEVPEEVRNALCINLVETIDEVLALALEDACPTDAGADEPKTPPLWSTEQPSQGIQTS